MSILSMYLTLFNHFQKS